MKKLICAIAAFSLLITAAPFGAAARIGDMGFNGGITEGTRLPKTTEQLLTTTKKPAPKAVKYSEVTALSGVPTVIEGLLTTTGNIAPASALYAYGGTVAASSGTSSSKKPADTGTYTVTQTLAAPRATQGANAQGANQADSIARNMTFNVNWRRVGDQLIEDWAVRTWTETISVGGETFTLQSQLSHYDVSVLTHQAAGVAYYKADISASSVYSNGASGDELQLTTVETYGSVWGYECAWSSTEAHRLDVTVTNPGWQLNYQIRPSVSVGKQLQWSRNEPQAISFEGNYREVMSNISGLAYDVFAIPALFWSQPLKGQASLATYNTFEQLPAVDDAYLKGHPAETDIKKLFSMGVLSGNTKFYQPAQAITRGEFVTMVAKAIKLPVDLSYQTAKKTSKTSAVSILFPDVGQERTDYPYILAFYYAGLAQGRGNGYFNPDEPLEREEAVAIMIRALGLTNLGLDPTPQTQFVDDELFSSWARREAYAALRLDIIRPDYNGLFHPKALVSKAEGAALVNRLIDYMREDIALDYTEHIVNYAQ